MLFFSIYLKGEGTQLINSLHLSVDELSVFAGQNILLPKINFEILDARSDCVWIYFSGCYSKSLASPTPTPTPLTFPKACQCFQRSRRPGAVLNAPVSSVPISL